MIFSNMEIVCLQQNSILEKGNLNKNKKNSKNKS